MPDPELNRHLQTCQCLTMITLTLVNSDIAQLSDVMEHVEHTIRCSSIVLQPAQQIDLRIGLDQINTHQHGVPPSKALTELPKFNQACAGVFLKIAFREPAQIGKLAVQPIQKLEITLHLIHRTSSAIVATELQWKLTLVGDRPANKPRIGILFTKPSSRSSEDARLPTSLVSFPLPRMALWD